MADSEAYKTAVQIGARINRRTRNTVVIVSLVVIASNAASVYLQRQQSADLHHAAGLQASRNGDRLAAKSAHNEALIVASAKAIRCVLSIHPNSKRSYQATQRCFATFDRLDRQGHP